MKRTISGLAIAIPAWRVLSSTAPASAASTPAINCEKVRLVYQGHHCASNALEGTCAGPRVAFCLGIYYKISKYGGGYCGMVVDDEGYCTG